MLRLLLLVGLIFNGLYGAASSSSAHASSVNLSSEDISAGHLSEEELAKCVEMYIRDNGPADMHDAYYANSIIIPHYGKYMPYDRRRNQHRRIFFGPDGVRMREGYIGLACEVPEGAYFDAIGVGIVYGRNEDRPIVDSLTAELRNDLFEMLLPDPQGYPEKKEKSLFKACSGQMDDLVRLTTARVYFAIFTYRLHRYSIPHSDPCITSEWKLGLAIEKILFDRRLNEGHPLARMGKRQRVIVEKDKPPAVYREKTSILASLPQDIFMPHDYKKLGDALDNILPYIEFDGEKSHLDVCKELVTNFQKAHHKDASFPQVFVTIDSPKMAALLLELRDEYRKTFEEHARDKSSFELRELSLYLQALK